MARVLTLVLIGATAAASPLVGQERERCMLELKTTPGSETLYTRMEGELRIDARDAVEATCGDSWVRADSATYFEVRGLLHLYGDVRYRNPERTLTAERATYYRDEERVRAEGDVRLTNRADGSTLTGEVLDYFPATQARPAERIFAPGRPHLTFYPSGPEGEAPFDVDADRIHIHGDSLVAGSGRVVARRSDLTAHGDSLHLDLGTERLWLLGTPSMQANGVLLRGDTILALLEARRIEEIRAWPDGSTRSRDMSLQAPVLRMFVVQDAIERVVAFPGDTAASPTDSAGEPVPPAPWARSESRDYVLTADSIDIRRPGGQLDRVIAVGRAFARAVEAAVPEDTVLGTDWLQGDTIVGYFVASDPVGAAGSDSDSASETQGNEGPRLRRLVASGDARALYHAQDEEGSGGTNGPQPVNYVIGRLISIWLSEGAVDEVRVTGPSTGVYLEPLPPTPEGDAADDTSAVADSVNGAGPQPGGVRP